MYLQISLCKLPCLLSRIANTYVSEAKAREVDNFLCDVTSMQKFDYYSADHTFGGSHASECFAVDGENPTTHAFPLVTPPVRSPRDKVWLGLKRDMRELSQLLLVTSLCSVQPLETHSFFQNAISVLPVDFLVK